MIDRPFRSRRPLIKVSETFGLPTCWHADHGPTACSASSDVRVRTFRQIQSKGPNRKHVQNRASGRQLPHPSFHLEEKADGSTKKNQNQDFKQKGSNRKLRTELDQIGPEPDARSPWKQLSQHGVAAATGCQRSALLILTAFIWELIPAFPSLIVTLGIIPDYGPIPGAGSGLLKEGSGQTGRVTAVLIGSIDQLSCDCSIGNTPLL
ncbi:hypothetical protein FQA47_015472 [Oryzias melastigma]|uniref:Uncharacterized protein n=1 Tax=Oryzias melastigma TaxID=30732 RepID=A0A834L1L8_ORYME|nr:hypothetical protein FQA47_015472 [Oryzias melastigma]